MYSQLITLIYIIFILVFKFNVSEIVLYCSEVLRNIALNTDHVHETRHFLSCN